MTTVRTKVATAVAATALGVSGAAVLAAPAGATASGPASSATACDRTPWEAKVQGRPAGLGAGSPSGDYLWHDAAGFHLRVTHANSDQKVYSGTLTASAPMRMQRVRLEPGDTARLSPDHRTITFVFVNHGHIDGVDFHTDCAASLTASRLHVGNDDLGRARVDLGAGRAHPAHVPFTVHRIPAPAT